MIIDLLLILFWSVVLGIAVGIPLALVNHMLSTGRWFSD